MLNATELGDPNEVKTEQQGLAESSGLKFLRSYIHWREFRQAAETLMEQFKERLRAVMDDSTRAQWWKDEQRAKIEEAFRARFAELTSAWDQRFAEWEKLARTQGRVTARPPEAEVAYSRALTETAMLLEHRPLDELPGRFETVILRDQLGEVDGWCAALLVLVPATLPSNPARMPTSKEIGDEATWQRLRARAEEVRLARVPVQHRLAQDNLAWLAMNRVAYQREREWLYANMMDLAPAPPQTDAERSGEFVAALTRPV